jgi:ketosteroid isomerase-like protein
MTTSEEVRRWAAEYRSAWLEADADRVAALFADDATYRSNIYEAPHVGSAGIAQYWRDVTAVQSDVDVHIGSPIVDGERAVVEFWTTMAIEGDPVTLSGSLLLHFRSDGLCTALREYWNFEQGTHTPPMGWGS